MADEWTEAKAGEVFKFEKEGDTLIGKLQFKRTDVGKNKSNMYDIQTEDKLVSVWGTQVLDDKIRLVPIGSEVKIEYLGKKPAENSDREYHDFQVFWK